MMLAELIYVATATVGTGFCCDRDKQMRGGGMGEEGREERREGGGGERQTQGAREVKYDRITPAGKGGESGGETENDTSHLDGLLNWAELKLLLNGSSSTASFPRMSHSTRVV
ncbi:unnamed protein product [Pleuronectes platessa]|uniref:Uncharacterized protein n=1 Tax=Pleuronectes platessa TaxID=8262 RepID=A0A9N7THL4_PLEPL|nr:unnamed protein product [Pleuronectes platessa]